MSVTYNADVKDDRLQVVIDAIDAGSGPGILQIGTTAMAAVLAEFTLDDPCATLVAHVLTFSSTPISTTATGDGDAAAARIRDSDATDVVTGLTVGTVGTNIIIDNTSILTGQTVRFTAGTITHG